MGDRTPDDIADELEALVPSVEYDHDGALLSDAADLIRKLAKKPDFGSRAGQIEARIKALQEVGAIDHSGAAVKVSRALPEVASVTYEALAALVGDRVNFSLIVWTEGRVNYIATAERDDVKGALKELVKNWDAGMPDVPAHEVV